MQNIKQEIEKVVYLSRLTVSETEKEDLFNSVKDILEYVELLNEIDTESVEETSHSIDVSNVFRDDILNESLPQKEVLKNGPKTNNDSFIVPKIIQ